MGARRKQGHQEMPKSRSPDYWDVRVTTRSPTYNSTNGPGRVKLNSFPVPCQPEEHPGLRGGRRSPGIVGHYLELMFQFAPVRS